MKNILIIILLIANTYSAFAQPSGYLGKRFNLSYSALTSFPGLYISKQGADLINYTNSINLEYVVEKRQSIGLRVQAFTTQGYINASTSELIDDYDYSRDNNIDFTDNYNLEVYSLAFDYIFYGKGWTAPLGSYQKLSLMYIQYFSNNFLTDNEYVINTEENVSDYTLAISYGIGKRWILKDKISIHAGAQLGICSPLFFVNRSKQNNKFNYESNLRLFTYMMFNLELGVGYVF